MRSQMFFTENDRIQSILSRHRISQGNLYHYTKNEIAKKICDTKEFRLSRADTFLDDEEIKYGVGILRKLAEHTLKGRTKELFLEFLNTINTMLQKCYVFSLSQVGNSQYLLERYSDGKTVIKLIENFAFFLIGESCHFKPIKNGTGNKLYHCSHLYRCYEGFVEYQQSEQEEEAKEICEAFQSLNDHLQANQFHPVDQFHFSRAIVIFIILCKKEKYCEEEEYRIALISNNKEKNEFEEKENDRIFISLRIAPAIDCCELMGINN